MSNHVNKKRVILRFARKVLLCCFFLSFLCYQGKAFYLEGIDRNARVTISQSNVSIRNLLAELEKQTGYVFFYNNQLVDVQKEVNVHADNKELSSVLWKLGEENNLSYKIMGKQIVLYPKGNDAEESSKNLQQTVSNADSGVEMQEKISASNIQQTFVVKGTITDETGATLPGAVVTVKGKIKEHVTTDMDGNFELTDIDPQAVLIVTFMGFETTEYAVNGRNTITIALKSDIVQLDEVVVTGYQVLRKEQMTGAVGIVNSKVLDQRIITDGNIAKSLEGQIAGMYVNPLNPNEIQIRGVSTFNAVSQPLLVIDGFPSGMSLSDLNPNDVASVSLLKDAAAAAIYGVRASNGVIVITTRKGENGTKTKFSARANIGLQPIPDMGYTDILRGQKYVETQRAIINISEDKRDYYTRTGSYYSKVHATQFDLNENKITSAKAEEIFSQIAAQDNLKQYEDLFLQNRINRQVDIDMSGGSERATYMVSANYMDNDLLTSGTKYQRVTVNMKGDYQLSKIFRMNAAIFYGAQKSNGKTLPRIQDFLPYEQLIDENGNSLPTLYAPSQWRYGNATIDPEINKQLMAKGNKDFDYYPYDEFQLNTSNSNTNNIRMQGMLQAKIIDGITIEAGGAYERSSGKNSQFYHKESFYMRDMMNTHSEFAKNGDLISGIPNGAMIKNTFRGTDDYTLRIQANINKTFASKHNISAIAGAELRKTVSSSNLDTRFGYDDQTLLSIPMNIERLTSATWANPFPSIYGSWYGGGILFYDQYFKETYVDNRFVSFYANAAYTFDQRYVLTGSFRIDESNLFGSDPKYRYKPLWSVGISWNARNEQFLSDVKWLDLLKVRFSTGFNGNIAKNNGPFIITESRINSRMPNSPTYNRITSAKNESLRWEQTQNYNAGIDIAVFSNRLSATVDYYYKYSKDLLGDTGLDPTSGFSSLMQNYAEMSNKGIEVTLESLNIKTSKFSWGSQLTASFNQNKVEKVKDRQYNNSYYKTQYRVVSKEYPVDALFSYDYRGLNNKGQLLVNDGSAIRPLIDPFTTDDIPLEALMYSGTTTPKYTVGFGNTLSYENFDLYFMFIFNGGQVMRTLAPLPSDRTLLKGSENFWTKSGDEAHTMVPGLNSTVLAEDEDGWYDSYATFAYKYANSFVRKADYVKLRELTLTYRLPGKWLQKVKIDTLRLRLQASNLWRYTPSGNDIDPEAIDPVSGIKLMPITPTYTFGITLNF